MSNLYQNHAACKGNPPWLLHSQMNALIMVQSFVKGQPQGIISEYSRDCFYKGATTGGCPYKTNYILFTGARPGWFIIPVLVMLILFAVLPVSAYCHIGSDTGEFFTMSDTAGTYNFKSMDHQHTGNQKITPGNGSFSKMFSAFVENRGQIPDESILFYKISSNMSMCVKQNRVILDFFNITGIDANLVDSEQKIQKRKQGVVIDVTFVNGMTRSVKGVQRIPGILNFFHGNDSRLWKSGVPSFRETIFEKVYENIDLRYIALPNTCKYEWEIEPGGDPSDIMIRLCGINGLSIDYKGSLEIATGAGVVIDRKPAAYQVLNNRIVEIKANFKIIDSATYGFIIGNYDKTCALIIDPGFIYSTRFASYPDHIYSITNDRDGNAYVSGATEGGNYWKFETTPGAYDETFNGHSDVFVAKLNADGSDLIFSTYVGGNDVEPNKKCSIVLDDTNNVCVTGGTSSPDFPVTSGSFDTSFNGYFDGFVFKLSADGSTLIFSTFLGGVFADAGYDIGIDSDSNIYVTGYTESPDFPTTSGTFDRDFNGRYDAFISKLSPDGKTLMYSTFLGGSGYEAYMTGGLAIDADGNAYVTGTTTSPDFPTTPGAFSTIYNGGASDVFVTRLNAAGSSLIYSTYIGGTGQDGDMFCGITIDPAGYTYVTGETASIDFPTTAGTFDGSYNGGTNDIFIIKLGPDGASLYGSTFIGGNNKDYGSGIVIDADSDVYITGYTLSPDFPVTFNALDFTQSNEEVILGRISSDFATLVFSTYIGGVKTDTGNCIAIDDAGMIYIGGYTISGDFPVTAGAYSQDAGSTFISKLNLAPTDTPTPSPTPTLTDTPTQTPTPSLTPVPCSKRLSCMVMLIVLIFLILRLEIDNFRTRHSLTINRYQEFTNSN